MERLRNNLRWKYIYRNQQDDNDYIPGLYINSKRNPDEASPEIEACMNKFQEHVNIERRKCSRRSVWPNLTPMQIGLIKRLGKNETHKIISADKNCGLAIVETEFLTERGISDHLSNQEVYKRLSKKEAAGQLEGVERLIESFISKYSEELSKAEYTYLK